MLAGGKIPLLKKAADWKLDLAHIGNLTSVEPTSGQTEKGLDYEAFLMLLLAEKNNRMYYRMCDLIQLNTALVQMDFLSQTVWMHLRSILILQKGNGRTQLRSVQFIKYET